MQGAALNRDFWKRGTLNVTGTTTTAWLGITRPLADISSTECFVFPIQSITMNVHVRNVDSFN